MPSVRELRDSPKLVIAHYFPAMPLSFDNQPAAADWYTRHLLKPAWPGRPQRRLRWPVAGPPRSAGSALGEELDAA